jgi:hypothetical protein
MQIACNDKQREKAFTPIRTSFDPDSNFTRERSELPLKRFAPTISISLDNGTTECNPRHRITDLPWKSSK